MFHNLLLADANLREVFQEFFHVGVGGERRTYAERGGKKPGMEKQAGDSVRR